MWSSIPNIIRASCRSSIQYRKYVYKVCCIRLYSKLPDLPTEGTGLPPTKRPDVPFVTIYDKYPKAFQLYKLENVYLLAAFNGTKRIALPLAVVFLTYLISQEMEGLIDRAEVAGTSIAIMVFIASYFSATVSINNFVGFLYIDQKTAEIIVSFVDFWGNRVDKKFEPGDLYFKARNNIQDKLYIFLMSRKTGEKFRINFLFSDVFSQELLEKHLGEIPVSAF